MKSKTKYILPVLIGVLLIGAVASVMYMKMRFDVPANYEEIKKEAYALYKEGKTEDAISALESYCTYRITDIEARATLGDWYYEAGNSQEAYNCYYTAAKNKPGETEDIKSLSVKNASEIMLYPLTKVHIEITPDVRMTKDMTLVITGHNIVPQNRCPGKIVAEENTLEDLQNYYTTEWFDVDPNGEYLTMSGGFNCAIWQFKDKNGAICATAKSPNEYRTTGTLSVNVYQMARAAIPDDATACRVTYFDRTKEAVTASAYEELTIVYGRLPGESRAAVFSHYDIPDLKDGEKIVYDTNGWKMVTKDGETPLDWETPSIERGSYIKIGGTLPGRVSFENSVKATYAKEGIYTIRFDSMSSSAMGERMDDAKNLGFNASVGSGKIALGENHFDKIYPWKDMKLCVIKDGKVIYSGENGFNTNGSAGDVFVEIPKFYVKRSIDDRYDTISISGVMHEGFEVDPAFVTKNGIKDKIYVAAYTSSQGANGELRSMAGTIPVLNVSPLEIRRLTENKGEGYYEMDLAMLGALQKLFMVETGLRNSQYFFMGACAYSIASDEENAAYHKAVSTNSNTNCINIEPGHKFMPGNNIVIFDSTNYYESYDAALKDVRQVKVIRENADGTQSVYFTGEPINIEKGVSAIAHLGTNNGTTRNVSGHTGAINTERGTVGFKYRNIENLWGNAYVYIEGVKINGQTATLTDRSGAEILLGYTLPEGGENEVNSMVRRVGYDVNNPLIMLPCEANSDATISTFYGDSYIGTAADKDCVLYHGGAWNSQASAGLFAFAAVSGEDENYINATGRMMYLN